jgi:uncharacterized protein (TIGR02611 family)
MLVAMGRLRRFRERLVLGPLPHQLEGDEEILAWTHAHVPGVRAPGVLVVTNRQCLLHVAHFGTPDVATPLSSLSGFKLNRRNDEVVRVRLVGEDGEVDVELSLSNRIRSRAVGRVLSALTRYEIAAPESFDPALTSPLPPMVRNVRHHARRVWVTVLGVLVLLLSAAFASPFLPGPGALTAVAGIAILAREYEWARDLHVWSARQVDRLVTWMRRRRRRRRREAQPAGPAGQGHYPVLEAEVPARNTPPTDGDRDGDGLAS